MNVFKRTVIGQWITTGMCGMLLLTGCVAQKKSVDPYVTGRQDSRTSPRSGLEQPVRTVSKAVESSEPEVSVQDMLMPTMTMINDRIYAYEQKLQTNQAAKREVENSGTAFKERLDRLNACNESITEILVEYNTLHERLLKKTELTAAQLLAGEFLLRIHGKDMAYLEGDCRALMETEPAAPQVIVQESVRGSSLHSDEKLIQEAYDEGEYFKVISRYEDLPLEQGQVPSFAITFLYGKALLKTQREVEARNIFNDLLETIRRLDQAQWEFRLMQLLGDLEFGMEIYDGARKRYREIKSVYEGLATKNTWANQQLAALDINLYQSDEVKSYAALLRSYLGYNPGRDGYSVVTWIDDYRQRFPYSPVASNADYLYEMAKTQADQWMESVFAGIDELAAQKKFQEALLRIERIPKDILPVAKQEELRRKSEQLTTSESIAIETDRLVQEQELEEEWNKAMTFLEGKKYDEAIEVFTGLLASSYEAKARLRIDEAALLAANEDRRRAAELFVRADRTPDMESKKKLLFASRQLLQDILIKYPQSGLSEKVKRNLIRIEDEIGRLDPTLLSLPTTVGGGNIQTQPLQ